MMKLIGQWVAGVWALPTLGRFAVMSRLVGEEKAFTGTSESLAQLPGAMGVLVRQVVYRRLCRQVGRDVYFGYGSLLSKRDCVIGDRVYIGRYCTLGQVQLDDEVKLADGVQVLSGRHQHAGEDRDDVKYQRVRIGLRSWVGANGVVMADVGKDVTVGAGAVVTKPVDDGLTVVGVPAKAVSSCKVEEALQSISLQLDRGEDETDVRRVA